jgi:uncharacterized protein
MAKKMSTNNLVESKVETATEDSHAEIKFQPKFAKARQYALTRLETELSPNLFYHRLSHTRDDVVPSAEKIASMEGIHGTSFYLLLTAAWFHDLGFIEQPVNHELVSARIASQVLATFGYTPHQVKIVQNTIYATILPQSPKNHLQKILADADLNVLGSKNFMQRNGDLRCERAHFGQVFTDVVWYSNQLKFLENHAFFTKSARALYNAQKTLNIAALKTTLEAIRSVG